MSEGQEGLRDDRDKPKGHRNELGGTPIHQIWDNLGIKINNDRNRPKSTKQNSKSCDSVDLNK